MAAPTRVDRIDFPPFFSVDPVDGLMVASHKKEKYAEGDVLAELFTTRFGRQVELGFFGGFDNGISIEVKRVQEFSAEDIKKVSEGVNENLVHIVNRPDMLVCTKQISAEGVICRIYIFVTPHGMLSSSVNTSEMSKAEADFYHKLFSSAQAYGSAVATKGTASSNKAATPVADLKAEGNQLIRAYNREISEIQSRFDRCLNNLYMECNNSDISAMYRVRSRFRSQVNVSGRELSACVLKLSDDGEKLVKRGADTAFIREMINVFESAQSDLELEVNVDTGGYGDWDIKYTVPSNVQELPSKWKNILNNHPDIAAERLAEARESETKRLQKLIRDLNQQITGLTADEPKRRQDAEKAATAFTDSASTIEKRLAQVQNDFDQKSKQLDNKLDLIKQQKIDCEQRIQQTQNEHQKTFFLAFGKKKALLAQIDELMRQRSQHNQNINDLDKQIEENCRKNFKEVQQIKQAHESLKNEMEQAKVRLEQLPREIGDAKSKLENAQKRLEQIPNMSLKELQARTSI